MADRSATEVRSGFGRWIKRIAFVLLASLALYLARVPILRGIGSYLVSADPLAHADVAFVLGGSATDRGTEAAKLHYAGLTDHFVCTGKNVPGDLLELGIDLPECEMTKRVLVRCGVPEHRITALREGTSTKEEAEALLNLVRRQPVDTVIVVSHAFHLRRARNVFEEPFREVGITVIMHPASSSAFDENDWWTEEQGLLMVQNEYVKLLYYAIKH